MDASPESLSGAPDADTRADRARALFEQTPVSLGADLFGIVIVTAMFAPLAPQETLGAWCGAALVLWAVRALHLLRWRQSRGIDEATLLRWRTSWCALVLLQGAVWGAASALFLGLGSSFQRVALLLVVFGLGIGAIQLLAGHLRLYTAFASLVFVPAIARIAVAVDEPDHLQLAGIVTLVYGMTMLAARAQRGALQQAIELKARTDQLARRLRVEMAAAEAARRAAEAANRTKTQFFAAASHDLRQPLHALGLFAEALRQQGQDARTLALVRDIQASVQALEGLFGELLDLNRIDSGAVGVSPEPIPLGPVFERLRLHFEPVAFDKGLSLRFRGARRTVHADRVLFERIVRNLVSNALRYTDDGGVLVSARVAGSRVRVQIWDSGPGIAEAELPRIFDEFYQVRAARQREGARHQGVGMGLAIARRLAELMHAPLSVRSRLGHGTVFTLELPTAGALPAPVTPARPAPASLQGRLVVVVAPAGPDRDGLATLLGSWGAGVRTYDSAHAVYAGLADAASVRPDLIIVDEPSRPPADGRSPLDAARAACRSRFGSEVAVPAIVVAESDVPAAADAAVPDVHRLRRPVPPARLRAMVAFKLGLRA